MVTDFLLPALVGLILGILAGLGVGGGSLLMLWSNLDKDGYCVALARSQSGHPEGPWVQEGLLFSKETYGTDGGHGMLFHSFEGQMYLCIHSPNKGTEQAIFLPITEKNDTLTL